VTGVQTCALPIWACRHGPARVGLCGRPRAGSPTKEAGQQEAGERREADGRAGALAHELPRIVAKLLDALLVEPLRGFLQLARSGARVVAILRAEVLVGRRGVLVDDAAQAGRGFAGLGLAVAGQPDGLGLGIAGPVSAARPGLLAIAADLVARLGTEGGGAGAGFLERRVEARLRL